MYSQAAFASLLVPLSSRNSLVYLSRPLIPFNRHLPALSPSVLVLRAISPRLNNTLLKSVVDADVSKTTAQLGLLPGQLVYLFAEVSGEAVFASTITFSDASTPDKNSLRRWLNNHDLLCIEKTKRVVIAPPEIQKRCKTLFFSHDFNTNSGVAETLSHRYISGIYAWYSHTMRAVRISAGYT